ncbi:MAG: argininosuccinate synthase [Planctomycetota bacterium]|jgi:argininosuccinate synthase|nr:argininosuccinate synthase [Planctomycetota bacterium]
MREKVILLYSGGLDTSVICRWLAEKNYDLVCFAADVGQRENWKALREKAMRSGAKKVVVADVREHFVKDFVFPAIRMGALYEGRYHLGTSLARPCIAEAMVAAATREKCAVFAHGATGKGNDQVRFELAAAALAPDLKVVAPWRDHEFTSLIKGRKEAIAYAKKHGIPVKATVEKPWSSDENLLHISYEAGMLENPEAKPLPDMFELTVDPVKAPDKAEKVRIDFKKGTPFALNGKKLSPMKLLAEANRIAGRNGVGRVDMVESRYIGMKNRGVYETPGGTLLLAAHRDLEGIAMDRDLMNLRDSLIPRMAGLIYNGYWFTDEMAALMALVEESQRYVTGTVNLELYKGNVTEVGRSSPASLYDPTIASMDDDRGAYDQALATGFIRLHGLPLRAQARRRGRFPAESAGFEPFSCRIE